MKKILLWGWSEADAVTAVNRLKSNAQIDIVEWIADLPGLEKAYGNFLYKPPDMGKFIVSRHDQALTEKEQIKFLHMFYRETRSRGVNFYEQINIAKNYFRYFLWLLKNKKVEHVIFSMAPLIGYDYLCYVAAKRLNIETTMCYQSLFPDRFFYFHNLDDFGIFDKIEGDRENTPTPEISWGYKKDLFYMNNELRRSPPNPLPMFIRQSIRHGIRESSKPIRYSGVIENYIQAKDFNLHYIKTAKKANELEFTSKFVYFPLHLQPELTTTGFGGEYSDQVDAIERLSEMVPADWKIYVKENPKQGYQQRGVEFFRRLSSMANVVYIGKEVDTYWLMEHCQFVATITGTAGWESITGGKPCLLFGLAWYAQIPGAVKYTPSITVKDILDTPINQTDQATAFAKIYKKTRAGMVDYGYRYINVGYTAESNSEKLYKFLEYAILKNSNTTS
jgi:hypothetical protein